MYFCLFLTLWILTTYLLVSSLFQKERVSSLWIGLGLMTVFLLPVYFASALPLVIFNAWSVSRQMMVMIVMAAGLLSLMSATAGFNFKAMAKDLRETHWLVIGFFSLVAIGFFQTRHSINHIYLTHDPGAYLSLAYSVARTGKFEQHNEIIRLAQKDSRVAAIAGLGEQAPEEWQRTKNYGVIPKPHDASLGGFHGFFGVPLWYATGIQLLGEEHALKMNWLALMLLALVLFCFIKEVQPKSKYLPLLPVALLVSTPLVGYVFREPLSEPVAAIAFVSLIYVAKLAKEVPSAFFVGVPSLLAVAIAMRISTLMYLPFVVLYFASGFSFLPKAKREWIQFSVGLLFFVGSAYAAFHISPSYLRDILAFYSDVLLKRLSPAGLSFTVMAMALIGVGFLFAWRRVELFAHRPKNWSILMKIFFGLLAIGVMARYGRLFTRLDYNIGGFPFVIFNLESLLFYGSPLVVATGLFYWARTIIRGANSRWYFVQLYLPFCLFFYFVFRFIPLNLQPNFQRYFLIEMIPLAVLGCALLTSELWVRGYQKSVGVVLGGTLVWNVGYAIATEQPAISKNGLATYQEVRSELDKLEISGRPAIIAVSPSWLSMAYLTPLSHGFGLPTGYLHFPFSGKARTALTALRENGYAPVLAVDSELLGKESSIAVAGENWKRSFVWNDCYSYPKFGLAAPPTELAQRCSNLTFLVPDNDSPKVVAEEWQLSWHDRNRAIPFANRHWFGFEVSNAKACRSNEKRVFSATIAFNRETQFEYPKVEWDGVPVPAHYKESGKSSSRAVEVVTEIPTTHCGGSHALDIFFPPQSDGASRTAMLLKATVRRATPEDLGETKTALK